MPPWIIALIALIGIVISVIGSKKTMLVLLAAVVLGASLMSLRQYSLAHSALKNHFGSELTLMADVRSDPVKGSSKVIGFHFAPERYSFWASTSFGPIRIIAPPEQVRDLLPGQRIRITGKILASRESRVAALVIGKKVKVITEPSRWASSLAAIRNGLRQASGDGDAGALIPGMVIGDTSKQSADFKNDMKRAGLTHLVAVSGANFAIVSAFVLWLMQFIFKRVPARLFATAIALAAFIALVRPSPSVLRAAAMAAVALLAMRTHRRSDSLPALGFAIAAVIFIDPWQARDPGFALSVLATLGLLLIAPRVITHLSRWLPPKIASLFAPPIAALALCLPIIVALSGYVSPFSIFANIFAAPFVAPITVMGFIAALISPLSPGIAHFLVLLIRPFASAITSIARWSAQVPVLTLSQGVFGSVLILVAMAFVIALRKKGLVILVLIVSISLWGARFPAMKWQVYICDVGQGDAMVINLKNHRAIVIDVGPDPQLIDRCLQQLDVDVIELLILTHPHADHVAGLSGAEKNRSVNARWYGDVAAGTQARIGEYSIKVLWPLTLGADDTNPNNNSIAALITSPELSLFASGDIEPPVQEQLRGKVGKVDIYKVAHHGSRFQDPVLMRELAPTLAVISTGIENTYGHPAPSTISSLERLHARVLRTDRDGPIAIAVAHHQVTSKIGNSGLRWISFG